MTRLQRLLPIALSGLAALLVASAGFAQPATPGALPPKLEPLPELSGESELEPQVTITRKDGDTIEEARVNGKIVWIKVTPSHGRPYFLIPDGGEYTYIRRDSFDTGLKVPLWLLFTF